MESQHAIVLSLLKPFSFLPCVAKQLPNYGQMHKYRVQQWVYFGGWFFVCLFCFVFLLFLPLLLAWPEHVTQFTGAVLWEKGAAPMAAPLLDRWEGAVRGMCGIWDQVLLPGLEEMILLK